MTPKQFRVAITALGMTQQGAARFLEMNPRTVRRYALGTQPVTPIVAMLLTLMLRHCRDPNKVRAMVGLNAVDVGAEYFE